MRLLCGAISTALMLMMQSPHVVAELAVEVFNETDKDRRGRSEVLDVRFFNAKQDAFEWRCSCFLLPTARHVTRSAFFLGSPNAKARQPFNSNRECRVTDREPTTATWRYCFEPF